MTTYPDPEADFHGRLYARLTDYLAGTPDAPFSEVGIEEYTAAGRADLVLDGHGVGRLVVEVRRADVDPRSADVVRRACAYADANGADFLATCNANDCFLFDRRDEFEVHEADFHYLDLRERSLRESIREFLDAVVHLSEANRLPDQHERERIVGVLRSFHSSVWPTLTYLAGRAYESDERFVDRFDEWVEANDHGGLPEDEQLELAAKQYAYLLTNRVLFSEAVGGRAPDPIGTESDRRSDSPSRDRSAGAPEDRISRTFEEGVSEVDPEPVFTTDTGLFEAFPHSSKTRRALADLVERVEYRPIAEVDEDLLGEVYEELIPPAERKALGQYYTHPKIAETIVRWAIPDDDSREGADGTEREKADETGRERADGSGRAGVDGSGHEGDDGSGRERADGTDGTSGTDGTDAVPRVLDPASGSGTFTVEAYQRLADRHPSATHQEIVDQLVSVDVNRFPLHLTSLNVASQNVRAATDGIHAHHASFFDLGPGTDSPVSSRPPGTGESDDTADSGESDDALGRFDAVVGNPPYIRQENLHPDREHFRRHLRAFGRSDRTTYYDGSKRLSEKSDAYVYFVTHAAQFLREGGRLGYIVPTKWMMTDYGRSFQEFLFDQFRVEAVVGFGARAFEDALVDTALLLLERCDDPDERANTVTKFVRFAESMRVERVVDAVERDVEIPAGDDVVVRTRPDHRTVALRQADVAAIESGKLAHFLSVPQDVVRLVEHPELIELGDVAEVAYGNKTGANDFFFLDSADLERWPIDERFLAPAIKSIRDADSQVVTAETTDLFLLDVHEYVAEVERTGGFADGSNPTERVKHALARDGHDALGAYVEAGEREGYHERSTCASRTVWFDLGDLKTPEILHPKFFDERIVPMWNRDRLAPSNAVDCIYLDDGIDDEVLLGILNSTVHRAILECWGRAEGGGALQLMTYEMETLPLVDPGLIEGEQRAAFTRAVRRLLDGDEDARRDLDAIVLDVLDADVTVAELRGMQTAITRRRVGSGDEVDVPMTRIDEFDEVGTRSFSTSSGRDDESAPGEFTCD